MLSTFSVFAGPSRTTYQAKIIKPDGYPLESGVVNFKFTILDPSGSCMLYAETYSAVNMGSTAGLVSFSLGSGVRTFPVSGSTFEQVFSNTTASLTCDAGGPGTYSPAAADTRKIVMQFNDGAGWQTLPAMTINAVPYAMYANDTLKFYGKDITEFVQVASLPTCVASQAMSFNGAGFSCVAAGGSGAVSSGSVITALGYTPADGASLTTVIGDVSSVSSTIFSVSSTVTSFQNSVAASFAAITSSQWLTSGTSISYQMGNVGIGVNTPVTKLDVSGGIRIGIEAAACAAGYAGTLRYNSGVVEYCNGTSWVAFGVSGAGILAINGLASGSQTFAFGTTGTQPNVSSTGTVHTFNFPLASTAATTAGLISYADYTNFTNKITSSAASIAQVLGYVPASATALGNYLVKANNLSDLASSATARSNLGLGSVALLNSVDLGTSDATGTLAVARLPSFVGDVTASAASNTLILSNSGVAAGTYTKVTVDVKGRVTSSAALGSSDVTTALGYTPAASGSFTSSQWNTSGTTINYMNGNVGVGTNAPGLAMETAGQNGFPATSGTTQTGSFRVGNVASQRVLDFGIDGATSTAWLQSTTRSNLGNANVLSLNPNGGYVGIGTSNPTQALDVSGTAKVNKLYAADGAFNSPSITFANSSNTGFYNAGGYLGISIAGALKGTWSSSSLSFNAGGAGPQIYFTGGNAAQPSYAFNVDSDTGMFNPNGSGGSNELGFSTSGTEKVRISSTGMVGIGTAAPTALLTLAAGTSATASFKLTSGTLLTSPQSGTMEYDGSNFYLTDGANIRRTIATGTSSGSIDNVSIINSSGNITMVPVGSVIVSSTTASTNSQTGALIVNGGLGVAGNIYSSGTIITSNNMQAASITALGDIYVGNRLGVGTSTPAELLHLHAAAGVSRSIVRTSWTDPTAYGEWNAYEGSTFFGGMSVFGSSFSTVAYRNAFMMTAANNNLGSLIFRTKTGGAYQERMNILNNGYVGIGTSSPSKTLDVAGTSIMNQLFLSSSRTYGGYGAPDETTTGIKGKIVFGSETSDSAAIYSEVASGSVTGLVFEIKDDATDYISFKSNAGTLMHVAQGGNVGMGTSAPTSRLHLYDNNAAIITVERSSNQNSLIEYKNTLGSMYAGLITATSNWGVGTGIDLGTTGVFQVTNTGRVYIGGGTTAPLARLQITPGTSSVAPIKLGLGTLLTSPQSGTIEYDGSYYYITDNAGVRRTIATATTGGVLNDVNTVSSTSNITLWPAAANSVIVSSTVASTNSSTGALIVNGGAGIAENLNVGGTISGAATIKGTGFRANQGVPDAADSSTVGYAFGADGDTGIFSPGAGAANGILSFYSNNAERMRMTASGALGIGAYPMAPLHVSNTSTQIKLILGKDDNSIAESSLLKIDAAGSSSYTAGVAFTSGGNTSTGAAIYRPSSVGGLYFKGQTSFTTMSSSTVPDLYIGSSGYVGIGTSTPTFPLSVSGTIQGRGVAYFTQSTPTNSLAIDATSSTLHSIYSNAGVDVSLGTNSSTSQLYLKNGGNVGIGSTAPNALLQVGPTGPQAANYNVYAGSYNNSAGQGLYVGNWASSIYWGLGPATSSADNTLRLGNAADRTGTWAGTQNLNLVMGGNFSVGSGTAATYKFLATKDFNGVSSQTAAFIGGTDAGTSFTGIYVAQKDNLSLSTNTSYLLNVVQNNNSKMVVTGAGNVGVGTTSPAVPLHVVGKSWIDNSSGDSATRALGQTISVAPAANFSPGADPADSLRALSLISKGSTRPSILGLRNVDYANRWWDFILDPNTSGKLYLQYTGTGGTGNAMTFDGGNVGIGTTSPAATLHVSGTMRVTDGNQAAARVLASDASGNASWKQTIIHGTIAPNSNTSDGSSRVGTGVSITLPPGRWQITGMGITTPTASCRADLGIRNSGTNTIIKYTLMPAPTNDYTTATVTAYVDIATTTSYDLYIISRSACTSQVHSDNNLWELTATGVGY